MTYLKLLCSSNLDGPKIEEVNVGGVVFNIWTVTGKGYVIEYDSNGDEIVVSGLSNLKGIFVYPAYRKVTCGGNPEGEVIIGVAEVEVIEG